MKTSEMIAYLEKHPEAKFQVKNDGSQVCRQGNALEWVRTKQSVKDIFDEYELLDNSIPWQEALQAWIDGKTITMEGCRGSGKYCHKCEYYQGKKKSLRSGDCLTHMCQEMFGTGTWYIEEGE